MPDYPRSPGGPESLLATRRALLLLSTVVRLGLLAVGLGLVLDRTRTLLSDVQLTWGERVVMGIAVVSYGGGFALAGWVADRLLKAAAELIGLMVDQAESSSRTVALLEQQVAPSLARVAVAVERMARDSGSGPDRPGDRGMAIALAGARQAIEEGKWDRADRLIKGVRRDFPGAPDADSLVEELADARGQAVAELRAKLDASRVVDDPDGVISFRDELTMHLRGEELRELDRQVVGWLMGLIQKRLRVGSVRPEVVGLADRVASSFGDTPEGASLRAALPTLRRSAGLCPRCARPYRGTEDACPICLRDASPRDVAGESVGPIEPEETP
ncbi:hypothetical protein [Tautonia plasticadhaerens]|uniref:Uncharacterized protein n=1 Tax=Tautonia plasticadhaerens TaxID=2527974 RepID=A0A518GXR8_9BACT|nr:hypothetical protein [Tautonia plasticadhaerens]QDV33389.1 hypothetical protein ElP_12600 [Tautonia plasticadhaerens]